MKITFCGANGTTTGSQHLLEVNGKKILLDCGLYQGRRLESYRRNRQFPFDPSELEAVVLSHAHIDHSGNLPNLVKQGFAGNIFCTPATRDLCTIMLADSARIQVSDLRWLNKHLAKEQLPPMDPLYTEMEAEKCLRQFVSFTYDRKNIVSDGVYVTFIDAGHILGAAQVILDIEEHDTGRKFRLLFSGDVGRGNNELLRDPSVCDRVDYLIMESTYGGVEHLAETRADAAFADVIRRALRRKGKIIIPAFAVERTQQLLAVFHRLIEEGHLKDIPIYVDSPLAVNATEVFRLHPECFNEVIYANLFEKSNPFGFESLRLIRSVTESKELNKSREPAIIISASGMCESGRILHHLRQNIGNASNTVLFVGYCAENTLGWKIRNGDKRVSILGGEFEVKAHIETIDSFSGHADHSELMDYYGRIGGSKSKVWLVHGERQRSESFAEALRAKYPDNDITVPATGDVVEI
jgi:metallo-beta-lactamase family protein